MKDIKKVVAQLLKDGAQRVDNLVVKNVTLKPFDTYVRVGLTLNKDVPAYVASKDESGNDIYVEGQHNVIFASTYSIGAVISNIESLAFAKNYIMNSPELLGMLLSYATITVVAQPVTKDEEYLNPFSDDSGKDPIIIDHNTIFHHITEISMGGVAKARLERMVDKIIDKMVESSFNIGVTNNVAPITVIANDGVDNNIQVG